MQATSGADDLSSAEFRRAPLAPDPGPLGAHATTSFDLSVSELHRGRQMNTGTYSPADTDRPDADRAAVARATTALLNAVNASDLTGVLAAWSGDGVLMPPHHPSVHGLAALEHYFRDLFSHSEGRSCEHLVSPNDWSRRPRTAVAKCVR
jgi:hypothetical protein